MWSDPEDIDTWAVSPRGAGWLFGSKVTSEVRHRAGVPAPPPGVHARALTGLRTGARRDGSDVQFTHVNGLALVARAHQLVQEGYKYMFPEKNLVTVWSAPNYCYRCGNVASILVISEDLEVDFKIFDAVPDSERLVPPRQITPYFI